MIRKAAAVLVAVAAATAAWHLVWRPWDCNRVLTPIVARRSAATANTLSRATSAAIAREDLRRLQPCLRPACHSVDVFLALAASQLALGRTDDARAAYLRALDIDRRPEIYVNLAALELAEGNEEGALELYVRAMLFNPWLGREISSPAVRREVMARVAALRPGQAEYFRARILSR